MADPKTLQHPARTHAGSHGGTTPAPLNSARPEPAQEPYAPSLAGGLMEAQERAPEPEAAQLVSEEISTPLAYLDPYTGQEKACALHSRIMNADERAACDRFAASLAGGAVWVSLPWEAQQRFRGLATCRFQLRDMPSWLSVALARDEVLLLAVYSWLAEHDATFFRPNLGASASAAGRPRVVLGAQT